MAEDIRNAFMLLATAFETVAKAMATLAATVSTDPPHGMEAPQEAMATEATATEVEKNEGQAVPEKEITFQELRSFMTEMARKGKSQIVQDQLKEYGAKKLSDVKKEDYADLMARVEYFAGELEVQDA